MEVPCILDTLSGLTGQLERSVTNNGIVPAHLPDTKGAVAKRDKFGGCPEGGVNIVVAINGGLATAFVAKTAGALLRTSTPTNHAYWRVSQDHALKRNVGSCSLVIY